MTHCKKTSSTLYARRMMLLEMKKMAAELNEHRYYLEQKVAQSTEHLQKRIALLESCNATLCGKLASSQQELAALQQDRCAVKLFSVQTQEHGWGLRAPLAM